MPAEDQRERLRVIGAFRGELQTPGFDAGTWHRGERDGDAMTLPWFELSVRANAFVRALGGIMQPGFDWPSWARTPGARALHDDRSLLATATPDDLARLVTAIVRSDRFNEGSLAHAFESGVMAAIAARAEVLAAGEGSDRPPQPAS